jgi:hypothetical protein
MREKEKGKEKESGGEIEREIVGEMGGWENGMREELTQQNTPTASLHTWSTLSSSAESW